MELMQTDSAIQGLRLDGVAYGTHQVPWDLTPLLHHSGASLRRDEAAKQIAMGKCGDPLPDRMPLIIRIHDVASAKIASGTSRHSISTILTTLWQFFRWADETGHSLTLQDIVNTYVEWVEFLLHRVRIVKDYKHETAYKDARRIGDLIGRALDFQSANPGISLLRLTRMRRERKPKKTFEPGNAAEHLAKTFDFGRLLADLCDALSESAIRGQMPLQMKLANGKELRLAGGVRGVYSNKNGPIQEAAKMPRALGNRAAVSQDVRIVDVRDRSRLINLRIEAELQIFIAQTGMNLAQAVKLRRDTFRWQTDVDSPHELKVYKGRRGGEVVFRCFKSYRSHIERYLNWLEATDLSVDERLFPFVYRERIPAEDSRPSFKATLEVCSQAGVSRISPRRLRKTRGNWLLRNSRNLELTAEQMAHTKETLLRDYEEPNYQLAAVEIVRFHSATDPSLAAPGPGVCMSEGRPPTAIASRAIESPMPDCVSPEGCLFCVYHRDVMDAEYCWKLASHVRLKSLELALFKPTRKTQRHPAIAVIERLRAKLAAIAQGSEMRAQWCRDAEDAVRAGRYHPSWSGHLELLEILG